MSLIPNLAPAFMAFGVLGLVVGRAGLGLTIIAAMTIGVVVDDTVHLLSKYLRARREHKMNPAEAVRYSFRTVGMAMTIAFAFALDVLFLPALLMKADAWTARVPDSDAGLVAAPVPVQE